MQAGELKFLAPAAGLAPSRLSPPDLPRIKKRSNACEACKRRKTKCQGTQPCEKCIQAGTQCIFAEELDRRKKLALRQAKQELHTAYDLLDQMVAALDHCDSAELDRLSSMVKEGYPRREAMTSVEQKGLSAASRAASQSSASSSSAGSLHDIATLNEDINRDERSRATGYIGKGSEIAWLQKLNEEVSKLSYPTESPLRAASADVDVNSLSYHLDHLSFLELAPGDPQILPPRARSDQLIGIYFQNVDPSFPLLNKTLFLSQYRYVFSKSETPRKKWLTILNLIYAIGAKYVQLCERVWTDAVDDRTFLARALALNADQSLLGEHADLQQVQIWVLYAIYHLASAQINRAWHMAGWAARCAIALGLNLRGVSPNVDATSRESRTRLWWSLFNLEQLLSVMTGRTSCLDWRSSSIPAPFPFDEQHFQDPQVAMFLADLLLREKRYAFTVHTPRSSIGTRNQTLQTIEPSRSLYFFHLTDLAMISHVAVKSVYSLQSCAGIPKGSRENITQYQQMLKDWLASLQSYFRFTGSNGRPMVTEPCQERVTLALAFYSFQIILTRPYLTRPDVKEGTRVRYPRSPFGDATSLICLQSAMDLVSIFPDRPDVKWLCEMTPWWAVLHYIMQALIILLIQLCVGPVGVLKGDKVEGGQGAVGTTEEPEAILEVSKKCLRWLHAIGSRSPSSRRAFITCERLLRRIATIHGFNPDGIPQASTLADRTAQIGVEHYYARHDHLQQPDPAHGDQMRETWWGADFTYSEPDTEEQMFLPFSLDPTLLEFLENAIE
ncbi:uncharacterized protein BO97DRAFT_387047 [Aspergillus homomorphus CBS 101889]|uniref:Zn(2)-C6 fungal-type domain-containing protein n=1 Tax=Aspergillus homomorphus (strain CBS 101889) TaxID=1450537 RepID=A0A395I3U2_ASPHC|nr:hypothetical protein BO97DRAFT_387047 [Aspergillus homomorphus CBS 101889]RAL14425.1 hypothetical protein BO97DRAFT_387047 [Aspergillus homomorphus CBS 101889]